MVYPPMPLTYTRYSGVAGEEQQKRSWGEIALYNSLKGAI